MAFLNIKSSVLILPHVEAAVCQPQTVLNISLQISLVFQKCNGTNPISILNVLLQGWNLLLYLHLETWLTARICVPYAPDDLVTFALLIADPGRFISLRFKNIVSKTLEPVIRSGHRLLWATETKVTLTCWERVGWNCWWESRWSRRTFPQAFWRPS